MAELLAYVRMHLAKRWYIGITDNPKRRLFVEHGVNKSCDYWGYWQTANDDDARWVEQEAFKKVLAKGNPGGRDEKATWVYIYAITDETRQ